MTLRKSYEKMCKLNLRLCINVMRVEKNVNDSVINTLLNIQDKTKDVGNARLALVDMGITQQLAPQSVGKWSYLPPTCHTMSKKEKKKQDINPQKLDELENETVIILC
ncbi:hypothetical protein CR513_10409, partial [Mucuna pruriens]